MTPQHARSQELTDEFDAFLHKYYHEDVASLATEYPTRKSLEVDYTDLYRYDNDLATDLLAYPREIMPAFNEALRLHDIPVDINLGGANVRIVGFGDSDTRPVGGYSAEEMGRYLPVTGQVAKVSQKKPEPSEAVFTCERCDAETIVPQSAGGDFQEPYACESCERQGPFRLNRDRSEWRDFQQVRLQQPPEEVATGTGATMDITLYDDLCEFINPGDRATISGSLSAADPSESKEFIMEANGVEREDSDYDESNIKDHLSDIKALANGEHGDIYELLRDSIAPGIYGDQYDQIKLAIALQLAAGVRVVYPDGSVDRGRFHMLLLGDPGTAKSEIVEAANQVAPRSIFTSGEGVSKVGLTASVVPDDFGDGKWSLEAGPMVKANEGVCCVDEIDKAADEAIEGLHTALEKQVVTVSKANFSGVEMQSRTSLLAAGNPKHGRFDPYQPVGEQIDLSPTLMSRFDLMFMLTDQPDREEDSQVIESMMADRYNAIRVQRGDVSVDAADTIQPAIDHDLLRAYFAYIHERDPQPVITEEIREQLREFLVDIRNSGDDDSPVPVTLRKVEALERLVEASARLRLAEEATQEDAKRATRLVLETMKAVGRDPETGEFDADVIETGTSKSQRERVKALLSIVRDLQDEYQHGAPLEDVLDTAEEHGVERSRAEHQLEELKTKGELYSPQTGYLRTSI